MNMDQTPCATRHSSIHLSFPAVRGYCRTVASPFRDEVPFKIGPRGVSIDTYGDIPDLQVALGEETAHKLFIHIQFDTIPAMGFAARMDKRDVRSI